MFIIIIIMFLVKNILVFCVFVRMMCKVNITFFKWDVVLWLNESEN